MSKLHINKLLGANDIITISLIPEYILKEYFAEEFTLKDLGITTRVFFGWSENNLLPVREKISFKPHKFNLMEYVWLGIIKDLRKFGLPLKKINKVKQYLFSAVSLKEYLKDFDAKKYYNLIKNLHLTNTEEEQEILKKIKSGKIVEHLKNKSYSVLFYTILQLIQSKHNIQLLVDTEGTAFMYNDFFLSNETIQELNEEVLVIIPLAKYVKNVIDDTDKIDFLSRTKLLDDNEIHILSLIREAKADSISVKFKDKKPVMIEVEKRKELESASRLSEILLRGGYEELTVKTRQGNIMYSNKKTKIKLD